MKVFLPLLAVLSFPAFSASGTQIREQRIPVESIHRTARQVMEQNDFRSVRRRVLENVPQTDLDEGFLTGMMETVSQFLSDTIFTWIGNFFRFLADLMPTWKTSNTPTPPPSPSGGSWDWPSGVDLPRILLAIVLIMVLAFLIWLIARVMNSHRNDPARGGIPGIGEAALELSTPPGELAASTYESRAIHFAEQGDCRAAIRELLLGSMSWIERAGMIRFRKGLTNRDYLRAIWRQENRRDAYLVTGSEFERVYFGRRTATPEMFQRCLTAFQGAFREEASIAPAEV